MRNDEPAFLHPTGVVGLIVAAVWLLFTVVALILRTQELVATLGLREIVSGFTGAVTAVTLLYMIRRPPPHWEGWPLYLTAAVVAGSIGTLPFVHTAAQLLVEEPSPEASSHTGDALRVHDSLEDRRLADRKLNNSDLSRAAVANVSFLGSDLSGSDFRGASFTDVNFSGARLCGVDIRAADLSGATGLRDVRTWSYAYYNEETKMPDGIDLAALEGPVRDTGTGLRYMCDPGRTRIIEP